MAAKTIFIEHRVGGFLTNAFSVVLASDDDSFGIKELDTGTIIAANNTAVQNPSTGRYEYIFDTQNQKIYSVSWKIFTNSDSDPVFSLQKAGPFATSDKIRSVTETRGVFKQGTLGGLKINITDFEGNAINPSSISLTIRDDDDAVVTISSNTSLEDVVPEKIRDGFFVFDWSIAATQPSGKYIIVWTYTVDGITEKEIQNVVVSENATDSAFYTTSRFILRESLEQLIACAMRVPIYSEPARTTRDLQTYSFTKGQWNQTPGIRLYRNDRIIDTGAEVDYFKGKIKFDDQQLPVDVVTADYTFRWFSDREIDQFIDNGINMLNAFPPFSPAFTPNTLITQAPQFLPAVLYGAAMDALRNLMMCLQFQEPQRYFGGEEGAQKAFSNMESLKQNYEKLWETLLGNKKLGPYPATRLVVAPSFTLPGGRSLLLTSKGLMRIDGDLTDGEIELKEAKRHYDNGHRVEILSQNDNNGDVVFAPVTHIWDSGIKEVFRLKCKNGFIVDSSDEHLFFANGDYKPLQHIKEGDNIVCSDGNATECTEVQSISSRGRKKHMLDLEVFSTANLFINGIKSHNSRWFRYLFSTGSG